VNLIIGLHQQNQGEIKIDDIVLDESNLQNWRSQIGYIPQQVYLFDGTIAKTNTSGSPYKALAMATRCFCPPLNCIPPSPTKVSIPALVCRKSNKREC
jgi:ABC-type phosphate/phosphonate transport system ATPase subunit